MRKKRQKFIKNWLKIITWYRNIFIWKFTTFGKRRKSINFASVMEAQKTEIVFLNENNIDLLKHLRELKIENIRILGNLIK